MYRAHKDAYKKDLIEKSTYLGIEKEYRIQIMIARIRKLL